MQNFEKKNGSPDNLRRAKSIQVRMNAGRANTKDLSFRPLYKATSPTLRYHSYPLTLHFRITASMQGYL